ncbi:DUF6801 domain-containing protein [Actinosynnema pretiosum]|nr:DUF6801 domain-containing protein [Actinosynnema pretiosum]
MAALGMSALVLVGSALFAAGTGNAATASLTLVYNCPFPLIGEQDMSVRITVEDLPDEASAGEDLPPSRVTAVATVPDIATQGLSLVGAVTVEGTAKASTRVDNAGEIHDIEPALVVARTDVPVSGEFDAIATGATPPVRLGAPGETTISVGDFETTLTPRNAEGGETGLGTFTSPCTLKPGQNTVLHTFTVGTGPTTTTTTTSETTTTTTSTTTTTTAPTTTTSTTTSSRTTTTAPTTTTTPRQPAPQPPAAAPPPPPSSKLLAYTGSSILAPLALGGSLLLLGTAALLLLKRGRRRH